MFTPALENTGCNCFWKLPRRLRRSGFRDRGVRAVSWRSLSLIFEIAAFTSEWILEVVFAMDAPTFQQSSSHISRVPAWAALQNSWKNILELREGQEAVSRHHSMQIVLSAIPLKPNHS